MSRNTKEKGKEKKKIRRGRERAGRQQQRLEAEAETGNNDRVGGKAADTGTEESPSQKEKRRILHTV